jgi:predicted alpha/beta-hydrolase family hydrolase
VQTCGGAVIRRTELPVRIDGDAQVTALLYEAAEPRLEAALILAHGAGAGQHSAFMTSFASALAELGVDAVTFNFLYTEQRRRIPDRKPALEACYLAVIQAVRDALGGALFIGGKSMGGRIATHVAADGLGEPPRGIVLLGYPLHPPGRPQERRDAHLPEVPCPMLFVQGSRDAFGTPAEIRPVLPTLDRPATLHVVEGGDHSLKVAKGGRPQDEVHLEVQRAIVKWLRGIIAERS